MANTLLFGIVWVDRIVSPLMSNTMPSFDLTRRCGLNKPRKPNPLKLKCFVNATSKNPTRQNYTLILYYLLYICSPFALFICYTTCHFLSHNTRRVFRSPFLISQFLSTKNPRFPDLQYASTRGHGRQLNY